jgi:hypothetical protein
MLQVAGVLTARAGFHELLYQLHHPVGVSLRNKSEWSLRNSAPIPVCTSFRPACARSRAGSLWGYRGATSFPSLSQSLTVVDSLQVRSSIGSSLIWDSPFGPLRVDYAYPVIKASSDITQRLHFGALQAARRGRERQQAKRDSLADRPVVLTDLKVEKAAVEDERSVRGGLRQITADPRKLALLVGIVLLLLVLFTLGQFR